METRRSVTARACMACAMLAALWTASSCDDEQAVVDPPTEEVQVCTYDSECDDDLFCNGTEECNGGACDPGADPCPDSDCDEDLDACIECSDDIDCDDELFCNGGEECIAGACEPGADPCPDSDCDEDHDYCGKCEEDDECDDDAFCNGEEWCNVVGGKGECAVGTDPCPDQMCDEDVDQCVDCLEPGDCDDGLYCTGDETCDVGACQAGTDPCVGSYCDDVGDECVDCITDAHCDDDAFCNGPESCVGDACQPGSNPCAPPTVMCDETNDVCDVCLVDGDCDDNTFCNGVETCVGSPGARYCAPGTPCASDVCDETASTCGSAAVAWAFGDDEIIYGLSGSGAVADQFPSQGLFAIQMITVTQGDGSVRIVGAGTADTGNAALLESNDISNSGTLMGWYLRDAGVSGTHAPVGFDGANLVAGRGPFDVFQGYATLQTDVPVAGTTPDETDLMVCGSGRCVGSGWNNGGILTSTDGGLTFTSGGGNEMLNAVGFGNGRFVGHDVFNDQLLYSDDGVAWQTGSYPGGNSIVDIGYGNGRFVGAAVSTLFYSDDGASWQQATLNGSSPMVTRVTYSATAGAWLGVGGDSTYWSADGTQWDPVEAVTGVYFMDVTGR